MTIGGGPDTFVVELAAIEGGRWTVLDSRRGEGIVELVMGGELIAVPARLGVERDAALEAVRVFVSENGARSARLQWSVES